MPEPIAGFLGRIGGMSFDVTATPAVTNGAYLANDIIGGVIELIVGRIGLSVVTLQTIQIVSKAAVTPTWTAHFLSAAPATPTDYEDNDAYALAVADAFLYRGSVSSFGSPVDHGTPNTWELNNLGRILTTDSSAKIRMILVDSVGVTLTSTSDIQVRVTGYQD